MLRHTSSTSSTPEYGCAIRRRLFRTNKATRELGWTPEPVEDSIRKAAVWFASR
jgi:hypothetical protein